jgi:hypothetical protein
VELGTKLLRYLVFVGTDAGAFFLKIAEFLINLLHLTFMKLFKVRHHMSNERQPAVTVCGINTR